nr:hypothetical protein [Tanacetum cinerariifolium]
MSTSHLENEAALCKSCDEKVHAANKLASKHQRVPISKSNNQMPKCDICQETDGYFFCLEDRALLCRKCDLAIHTVNSLVSLHQRFLLTGVKIGLETTDVIAPSTVKSVPFEKIAEAAESLCVSVSENNHDNNDLPVQTAEVCDFAPLKLPFGGGSTADGIQQWQFDDFFGLSDLNQDYNYIDSDSSKADSSKMGDSDRSLILRALEVELDSDDCLGQVPDSSWSVPEIPSPPTASGLCWPKQHQHHNRHQHQHQTDTSAFVPDICYSSMTNFDNSQQTLKRRRHL